MPTTVTLETLLDRVADEVWKGKHPVRLSATGGTTTTFVAGSQAYTSYSANAFDGAYIYIIDTTDDAAPKGEISRVTSGGFAPSTGTFTVAPAYTVAPASGDVGLILRGLHVDNLIEALNQILRNLKMPRLLPIGAVTDGDMESTGVTNWAAVGSPTTREKTTTAADTLLQRSLHLVGNSGAGATSNNVLITDTENVLLSVAIKVISGSYNVILYDNTSGQTGNIRSVTVDESDHTEVRFDEGIPSGCEAVTIRILSAAAAAEASVSWAQLYYQDRHNYAPPSDFDEMGSGEVLWLPLGLSTSANYVYALGQEFAEALQPFPQVRFPRDFLGQHPSRLSTGAYAFHPLFVKYRAQASTLSALTDTVAADGDTQEAIVWGAMANCCGQLRDKTKAESAIRHWEGRRREAARNHQKILEGMGLGRYGYRWVSQHRVPVG